VNNNQYCIISSKIKQLSSLKIRVVCIQGVSKIGALILTGNRTQQKEQLFSLPFWRKTLRDGLKN
jgi:hypothetical protein